MSTSAFNDVFARLAFVSDMSGASSVDSGKFESLVADFVTDLVSTFPECAASVAQWWSDGDTPEQRAAALARVRAHCESHLLPRALDVFAKNEAMFGSSAEGDGDGDDTEFLPGIHFRALWQCDNVSPQTKAAIWSYLHHLTVLTTPGASGCFDDLLALMQAQCTDPAEAPSDGSAPAPAPEHAPSDGSAEAPSDGFAPEQAPAPAPSDPVTTDAATGAEAETDHVFSTLLSGSIGKLAMEIVEDAVGTTPGRSAEESAQETMRAFMQDPTKMFSMLAKATSKMDAAVKSGSMNQSDIVSEAHAIMDKFKTMPEMAGVHSMLGKLGLDLGGGGASAATGTPEQIRRREKMAKTKERVLAKHLARQAQAAAALCQQQPQQQPLTEEELVRLFHPPVSGKKK